MEKDTTPTGTVLLFDQEEHSYRSEEGVRYDAVTFILEQEGYIDTSWFGEEAAFRGTWVHEAIKKINLGQARFGEFTHGYWWKYIEAYMWFMIDTGFRPDWVERFVCDDGLRIAGCLDITGSIEGKTVLIDIKTGDFADWHPTQLAAYGVLGRIEEYHRYTLHLKRNGRYTLKDRHKRLGSYQDYKWIDQWHMIAYHWRHVA